MPTRVTAAKRTCDRCHQETDVFTMSFFNEDEICPRCDALERNHPLFQEAQRVEQEAVRHGNYNFPGVGVPPDLVAQSREAAKKGDAQPL